MTAKPLATEFLVKNVACLRDALDQHNASCEGTTVAFVLHPYDRGVLPFDELWGVPLVEDANAAVKRFWVACSLHHAGGVEPLTLPSDEAG